MEEDSEIKPMKHVGETLQDLVERLSGKSFADDPCPICLGTGTELIESDNVVVARTCRHIG